MVLVVDGGVLRWLLGGLLLAGGIYALGQVHRTRDRVNFLLVLLDMTSEVMRGSQPRLDSSIVRGEHALPN